MLVDFLKSHIMYLEERGYKVKSTTNGQDAIDKVIEEPFDLIFLDESMPGLSGLETLQELKKIRPNIPVVLVTKNEEEDLMELSTDGVTLCYKEEYQDIFNHWYDHYLNLLMGYSE